MSSPSGPLGLGMCYLILGTLWDTPGSGATLSRILVSGCCHWDASSASSLSLDTLLAWRVSLVANASSVLSLFLDTLLAWRLSLVATLLRKGYNHCTAARLQGYA